MEKMLLIGKALLELAVIAVVMVVIASVDGWVNLI